MGLSRQERGRVTRRALLEAARREFGVQGYGGAAVEDIVKRAGVTKGAFYHHFSGKQDLFAHVYEDVRRELSRAAFVTHVDHQPFVSPEDQPGGAQPFVEQTNDEVWRQLVERCRRFVELHTRADLQRIVVIDAPWVLPWEERQRIEAEWGVVLLRADLRRAMRRGILRSLPLGPLAVILSGALNQACVLVANADEREEALEEAMAVVNCFLEGLRESGASSVGAEDG